MKCEITYHPNAGVKNTIETLKLVKDRAIDRNVKTVAIASIRGGSAERALQIFKDTDINLIFCTCNACHGCDRFSKVIWEKAETLGHKVVYTNEDAIPFPDAAGLAYRRICQGMKVCVQISMSLVDQGIVQSNTEIIAVAGTGGKGFAPGWGVDTAIVIKAVGSQEYWQYERNLKDNKVHGRKIKQIICMPG